MTCTLVAASSGLRGVVRGRLGVKDGADVLVAVGTVLNGRQLLPDGSFVPLAGPGEYRIAADAGDAPAHAERALGAVGVTRSR